VLDDAGGRRGIGEVGLDVGQPRADPAELLENGRNAVGVGAPRLLGVVRRPSARPRRAGAAAS